MNYYVSHIVTYTNERGNPTVYKPGSTMPARVYNKLSDYAKAKCIPMPSKNARMNWTKKEIRHIVNIYLKTVEDDGTIDMKVVYAEHQQEFPERGTNALNLEVAQIQHLDTHVPQQGMHDVSQMLVDVLHAIDADRFPSESSKQVKVDAYLDNLLAQIRG
jgi:hypothetical protein